MEDFIKKVLDGNRTSPSDLCLKSFNENFKGAISVEWFQREDHYEVIFYRNGLEHIAMLTFSGNLLEYSQNLSSEFLPNPIKESALSKGEIMNSILRNRGNMIEFEVIVRDKELIRYLLVFSEFGQIIETRKL